MRGLRNIYVFQIFVFMYKTIHNLIPHSCVHNNVNVRYPYNLRKPCDFVPVPFRTNIHMKSTPIDGPRVWESLPSMVKLGESVQLFKS